MAKLHLRKHKSHNNLKYNWKYKKQINMIYASTAQHDIY